MIENKRIIWIDVMKFICMFFIIVTHTEIGSSAVLLSTIYNPFILTGFLFASGYTYKHMDSFLSFLKKKIHQLLIPWFAMSFSTKIIVLIFDRNYIKFLDECFWNLLQIREVKDAIWFVAALFIAYIPFYFLINSYNKHKNNNNYIFYLIFVFALYVIYEVYIKWFPMDLFPWGNNRLPWHLEYISISLFYMFLGYLFKDRKVSELFDNKKAIIFPVMYILLKTFVYLQRIEIEGFLAIIYSIIFSIFGVISLIVISKRIKQNKLILFVGQNTLLYFGLHPKALKPLQYILNRFIPNIYKSILCSQFLSTILSFVFGLCICIVLIIPIILIKKYLPFFAGASAKKH